MTLTDWANIAEILGVIAIIFGIVFGSIQVQQHRKQARTNAIMELARSFEDREFTEAYRLIANLSDDIAPEEFEGLGDDYVSAGLRVSFKFETIGLLIYKGVVPLDAMRDLVGGAAVLIWGKLRRWIEASRQSQSHDLLFEWFQWLVEQIEERGQETRRPAYEAYKDWRESD